MRHRIKGRKLNRTTAHRKAMLGNMTVALIMHEQIETTLPKAKELRPFVEKLITTAKNPNLSSKRKILAQIKDENATEKLINVVGKRYAERPGGYIRIIRAGSRYGDNAPMAYIELVERNIDAKGSSSIPREEINAMQTQ